MGRRCRQTTRRSAVAVLAPILAVVTACGSSSPVETEAAGPTQATGLPASATTEQDASVETLPASPPKTVVVSPPTTVTDRSQSVESTEMTDDSQSKDSESQDGQSTDADRAASQTPPSTGEPDPGSPPPLAGWSWAKVSDEVAADVVAGQEVAVIVTLAGPSEPEAITAARQRVLDALEGAPFRVRVTYEAIPAFAGFVADGTALELLNAHPDVVHVGPDVGGSLHQGG